MPVETKRRGRPAKAPQPVVAAEESAPAPPRPEPEMEPHGEPTPPCHVCGRPLEKSTMLLRAYGMAAYRCTRCRHVAIDGDHQWFDFRTALSGDPPLLVERAAALYAAKRFGDLPIDPDDRLAAAMHSGWDDARWTTFDD